MLPAHQIDHVVVEVYALIQREQVHDAAGGGGRVVIQFHGSCSYSGRSMLTIVAKRAPQAKASGRWWPADRKAGLGCRNKIVVIAGAGNRPHGGRIQQTLPDEAFVDVHAYHLAKHDIAIYLCALDV